jgi:Restriction endonuclease/NACHT domain/Pentapeptide repeats (8 copies)
MSKKTVRKRNPNRRTSGKASVSKGDKFEQDVAELYRLLGAEVTQNIQISNKKVDILATFSIPGSSAKHRLIVECKDEKRRTADNQRVMQFHGLLESARKLGMAESAEIITRVSWSDAAKGYAKDNNIGLFTYREKIAQLIDFAPYLRDLIHRFDTKDDRRPNEPPLGEFYVSSSGDRITTDEPVHIPLVDEYLKQWAKENKSHSYFAVLGEYGTGKSSLCKKLARDLAESYLASPGSSRIPILFNLREFTKKLDIEAFVSSFLDRECGVTNPRFKLFKAMNDAGILFLIFDAFDEMAVRVDADTLELNLQEIDRLAAAPHSKVIITSRIEYFTTSEEQERVLRPKGNVIETRSTVYELINLITWNDIQIASFLEKRVPLIKEAVQQWTYYRDRIRNIPGLSDLSRRPVLLDMIVRTLPELIASGKPINRPNLYETYLLAEIKRQKLLKRRELLLPEGTRFALLQNLSLDIYSGDISTITFSDALNRVCSSINPPKSELEAYTREFLACSFLMRKGDEYRFSHNSIMEYLVAKSLRFEIDQDAPDVFGRLLLQPVVAGFLVELNPKIDTLWHWIEKTKTASRKDSKYVGGNSATLLCMLNKEALRGKNLSKSILSGANLSGANLERANLDQTIMKNVGLENARFLKDELGCAQLEDFRVSLFLLGETPTKGKRSKINVQLEDRISDLVVIACMKKGARRFSMHTFPAIHGNLFLIWIVLQISRIADLNSIYDVTISNPWIKAISVYSDEQEQLFRSLPEPLKDKFRFWTERFQTIRQI